MRILRSPHATRPEPVREARVLEDRLEAQARLFEDAARGAIGRGREADDLAEPQPSRMRQGESRRSRLRSRSPRTRGAPRTAARRSSAPSTVARRRPPRPTNSAGGRSRRRSMARTTLAASAECPRPVSLRRDQSRARRPARPATAPRATAGSANSSRYRPRCSCQGRSGRSLIRCADEGAGTWRGGRSTPAAVRRRVDDSA